MRGSLARTILLLSSADSQRKILEADGSLRIDQVANSSITLLSNSVVSTHIDEHFCGQGYEEQQLFQVKPFIMITIILSDTTEFWKVHPTVPKRKSGVVYVTSISK